jgi:lipopolysaccharide biosynthesis regulator YciM
LNSRLEQVDAVVETLVIFLSKGELTSDLFPRLHQAAVRDGRLADLAFAYEQVTQERRVRALGAEAQGILFGTVAEFYEDLMGDRDSALAWAERAVIAHPCVDPHFVRFERWIMSAGGPASRLARARVAVAKSIAEPDVRRGWLAQSLFELSSEPSHAAALEILEAALQVDAEFTEAAVMLEMRLLQAGRFRDAARRMEARLQSEPISVADAVAVRERLLTLYTTEMADPFKAIAQVEALLGKDPANALAIAAGEKLSSVASVAARAITALADAHYAVGNLDRAAALLSHELKTARGPRRQEVQGKLAILRQDVLGDSAGALELLGPVVAVDASRDEFRDRFVQLSLKLNRTNDAVRLLGRALQGAKEPILRSRLGCDLGTVLFHSGEGRRARSHLEDVIRADNDPPSTLRAARLLVELYQQSGEAELLAPMLELVVEHETDQTLRETSAYQLIQLSRQKGEPRPPIIAWQALIRSVHAEEALAYLREYYEESGQIEELAGILELLAARNQDPTERMAQYWRAAELRAAGTKDIAVHIGLWRNLMLQCGASKEALDHLIPLLDAEARGSELADALQLRIELAEEAEKAQLWSQLGRVRLRMLGDAMGALRCHANALSLDPKSKSSRVDLESLLEIPECRADAAALLEPILRAEAPGNALFMVLALRAESSESLDVRFAYYTEAFQLAVGQLGQSVLGLRVACRALKDALSLNLDNADEWVAACARLQASVLPLDRAECFSDLLQGQPLDRPVLRHIAVMACDALHEAGQAQQAETLLRSALEYDPASPELLMRLDEILASQASPEQRLALYQEALARNERPERQRDIHARVANLFQKELGQPQAAIEAWNKVIELDPQHLGAHQSLLALHEEAGNIEAVAGELERALGVASGERRQRMLEQLAQVEERRGNLSQALQRAQESLQPGPLDPEHLLRVQKLAERAGDLEAVQSLIEQQVPFAASDAQRVQILSALGEIHVQRGSRERAVPVLRDAATLAARIGEHALERKLLERAVELAPSDLASLTRLVEHCASAGDIAAMRDLVEPWLAAGADERDVLRLVLDLETSKRAEQQPAAFAGLCENCAILVNDPARARSISLSAARVLSAAGEARSSAQVHRNLISAQPTIDREVLASYVHLLNSCGTDASWRDEWRWLFEQRVAKAADKVSVLLEWANHEETHHEDIPAALAVYDNILQMDPTRFDVWSEVARLRQQRGDAEGTLAALDQLLTQEVPEKRAGLVVQQAQLLVGPLGRAADALDRIESIIGEHPSDPGVLSIVRTALELPEVRQRAAELLQKLVTSVSDPAAQVAVLESLLEVTNDAQGFEAARAEWTLMLLDLQPQNDDGAISVVLREATRMKTQDDLWDRAEQIARRLGQPDSVLVAYQAAFDHADAPEVAEHVGRRLVEFQEEWSDDTSRTLPLLQAIFERCQGAFWAFDRLKLAYNAGGRWQDLFNLYDQAISQIEERDSKAEMLREAAMAAKDFANDATRAIDYFEKLDSVCPNDARVEAALERLYERQNLIRPLIELLIRQMGRAKTTQSQFPIAVRITSYWLDVGEAMPAFELLEGLLKEFSDRSEVVDLLERLVELPSARETIPPAPAASSKKERRERNRPLSIRDRSALRLRKHYESVGNTEDAVRMLEIEVDLAVDKNDRIARLRRIIDIRLSELDDVAGAFEDAVTLLQLAPERDEIRKLLDELAARYSARDRQEALLVSVADSFNGAPLRVVLLREAADIACSELSQYERAIELYTEVLNSAGDDRENACLAAHRLDQLLAQARLPARRCDVLERLADLERDPAVRRQALGEAAIVALDELNDAERAVVCWRKRLADDADDAAARDGLIVALERTARHEELIRALAERAERASDDVAARADRVRIAGIWRQQVGSAENAIAAWQAVRETHGRDQESYDALVDLYTSTERWRELALLVCEEADCTSDAARAKQLRQMLGGIYAERLGETAQALRAYVQAQDWDKAISVATSVRQDAELALRIDRELLKHAVELWTAPEASGGVAAGRAAAWSIGEITSVLKQVGAHEEIVGLLLEASRLPFTTNERRTYLRDASYVCSNYLNDKERAIGLYQELVKEDPADSIASQCISPLAALLEQCARTSELVELWEGQAAVSHKSGDDRGAAALYARAAELAESKLDDVERALADYTRAADFGLETALEALARLHDARKEYSEAAKILERYCAVANRECLGERSLWLAQAYVNSGRPESARACLEHASANARDVGPVRSRLAELYEEASLWAPLAEVLTTEAARSADPKQRLLLLVRAAHVHRDQRGDATGAVPLFEQAVQLDSDNVDLRIELANALSRAERHAEASQVLRDQIARYGTRRPKERAMVHHALARELLALEDKTGALEELHAASRIDPTRAEVLSLSGRLSMDLGDLETAEKTFRSLLLVLGRGAAVAGLSRVEALLDLSEIALRREDAIRSSEYVESAFEIAQDLDAEAQAFERAARARGRNDWLLRVLEERLARAARPSLAAPALLDLTRIHAETLGDLPAVASRITERAHQIHENMGRNYTTEDTAWTALSKIYEYLGDETAQAKILELRVQSWLDGKMPVDDPKPVMRMGAMRLRSEKNRAEGLRLLALAHQSGASSQELEQVIMPILDEVPDWVAALDLLEKTARVDGNTPLLAKSLLRRLSLPNATSSQYAETVELLRGMADVTGLSQVLAAATDGTLGLKLDEASLASARLELADIVASQGDVERALELREVAADSLASEQRTAILLQSAAMAAEGEPPHNPERAIRLYQKLLEDAPGERQYWVPLLALLRRMGDSHQLVAVIDRTVRAVKSPEDRACLRLEQARLLIDAGQTTEAADELRAILSEDPGQSEAAILLVGILEQGGKFEELIQMLRNQFDNALRSGDSDACVKLLARIASLSEKLGHFDEALSALERALNFQGANREVLERIVELSERLGESKRAVAALQMLQDAESDPRLRLLLLDKLYSLNERINDPLALLQTAQDGFNCAPSNSTWQNRLFKLLQAGGDLTGLSDALNRASLACPADTGLTLRLVEVNRQLGNYSQALEVLDGVLASGVESASLSCERGRLLLELGRYQEALTELELADDSTPAAAEMLLSAIQAANSDADPERSRQLGVRQVSLLTRLGRDHESQVVLSELHAKFPEDLTILELWANWLATHGSPAEAVDAFEQLTLAVDEGQLARAVDAFLPLCDAAGTPERALPALQRAVPVLAERADLRQRLVDIYRQLGKNRELGELLLVQAEFETDPAAKHALLLQGAELLLLEPSGDFSAARQALERARALVPDSLELVILLARLHATEGNTEAALELLQSTAQAHRGRRSKMLANLYRELSRISLEQGLRGEALDAMLRAFEMDSKNGQLAMQTGRLAMDLENYDVAVRVFARVAMMKPIDDEPTEESITHEDRADANYCLAYLSYNQGDTRKAKILALKAISDNAQHEQARRLVEQLG